MKRLLILLLALLMLTTAACGNPSPPAPSTAPTDPTAAPTAPSAPAPTECSHFYKVSDTVSASCTQAGYTKYVCDNCGHDYKVEIPPIGGSLGHNYEGYLCTRCPATSDTFVVPECGYDGSPVTITFYSRLDDALHFILCDAIVEFNRLYPNITIFHQSWGDYNGLFNQVNSEIALGTPPNLAYCYPDHVTIYNKTNAVQPLDSFIESPYGFTDAQIADFIPAFYNEGKAFGDGCMYSLPISKSTEVMYYNKTFFDTHGLSVPTTWEEMAVVCERIKEIDPYSIPLGYDSDSNWFITMAAQYNSEYTSATGENFRFDNETNHQFVKMLREWYQNGWITTESIYGGYTSTLFTGMSSYGDVVNTRCYMCIGSSGGATYQQPNQINGRFEFEVGITTLPQVNPDQPKVISQGPSICIFKSDDVQEVMASWWFSKFLATNVEFQSRISMRNGYAPVIRSVMDNPNYTYYLNLGSTANLQAYAAKVALEQADAYFVTPAFDGSAVARSQVGLLLQKCMTELTSNVDAFISKAFSDAVEECRNSS